MIMRGLCHQATTCVAGSEGASSCHQVHAAAVVHLGVQGDGVGRVGGPGIDAGPGVQVQHRVLVLQVAGGWGGPGQG